MHTSTYQRLLAISGILFAVLLVTALLIANNQVDENASMVGTFNYWTNHKVAEYISGSLMHVAAVMLVFFGAGLRTALRDGEGEESTYSLIAFGGSLFAAVGFAVAGFTSLATATAADQGAPAAVYTLNQLNSMNWVPFTAGLAVMMLAAGIGGLRTLAFPKLVSWVAVLLGIAFLTPAGPIGLVVLPFWVLAISVALYRRPAAQVNPEMEPVER